MRRWQLTIPLVSLLLAGASIPVHAGPNAGGTLVVHDLGVITCFDGAMSAPPTPRLLLCSEVDNEASVTLVPRTWKVYAAFPLGSSPRLKQLSWGASFGSNVHVLAGGVPDPVVDLEVSEGGWPLTSGGSIGEDFGVVQVDHMVECYWLGGYAYAEDTWQTQPHATHPSVFVDDSLSGNEDPITAFGSLGFGRPGLTPCPDDIDLSACCIPPLGECRLLLEPACVAQGGVFFAGVDCQPNPCEPTAGACCLPNGACALTGPGECAAQSGQYGGLGRPCEPDPCVPVAITPTSWGQVKSRFR
jgi:hypothetical protein